MEERPNWHRFWKRRGDAVELALLALVLLAAAVIMVVLLLSQAQNVPPSVPSEAAAEEPTSVTSPKSADRVIYLTFDDGPGQYTPRLLEILEKYDVKATFFFVNTEYADVIAQVAEAGHTLGMHTATHEFAQVYASEEAYFEDLEQIRSVIEKYSGQSPVLLRFPGGSSNTVSRQYNPGIMTRLTGRVEEMGYLYFDWNVDADDAGEAKTAREVYKNVTEGCSEHSSSVVLMHDIHDYTVDAVEAIIVWGIIHGYTFEALTADSPTCHHAVRN